MSFHDPKPIEGDYDEETKGLIYRMLSKDPQLRPSTHELYQTDFIHERVRTWCLKDEKIKVYVESMVNVHQKVPKTIRSSNGSKNKMNSSKEHPNYYAEN